MLHLFELIVYEQHSGRRPFDIWFESLRDKRAQSRVIAKLDQVRAGNLGDCKSVGEGVIELRIDVGAGYRTYCEQNGDTMVMLLCGEDRASQSKDIDRAKGVWTDWKRRTK